jgi:signal transduction histidine kinase
MHLSFIPILLTVGLSPAVSWGADSLPRSVLILDQSDAHSAWYGPFSAAFRSTLYARSADRISVYAEHLDLSRFGSPQHDELLRTYLGEKFRARPIGLVVAQGSASLEFVMRSREQLWPGVPVVFAAVDEETATRLNLPPDVTGTTYHLLFRSAVNAARALVPNLKRIALVGDSWERQAVRRHYKEEIPAFAGEFEFIDLIGLPMTEIRKRVAVLPEDTAIVYTSVTLDGAQRTYIPHESLAALAEVANRPVVVDTETNIGHGATGGFVAAPVPVGEATARLALRILDGEDAAMIPVATGDFNKPVFDWRELQRFGISESSLPPRTEVRFREFGLWEQHSGAMTAIVAALLLQAVMIAWLLLERRRRRLAESELRQRLLEVVHLNRTAIAGALSASVAHELNQPLGAIQSSAEAAEIYLKAEPPNIARVEQILANIRRDDRRAADIISHLRALLKKKDAADFQEFDFNEVVQDALQIIRPEALKRGVELTASHANGSLPMRGDRIHLQQVILNLAMNGMDAMQTCAPGSGRMSIQTALAGESAIEVEVADSGTGIPQEKLNEVFDTFYTTKRHGTGLGLSIARTIVETYGGRIWAENRRGGGAAFRFTLPLSKALAA